MKKILLIILLLLFTLTYSQERRDYNLIDEGTVEVKVYRDNILKEKGYVVNIGERWVNDGLWVQYDKLGKINLKVRYSRGVKLWVSKQYDNYVVIINKKGDI